MVGLCGHHKDSQGQSSSVDTAAGRKFDATLFSTLDALEEAQVSYALIGGIAASGLGRPRSTQDIDIFVRPEDAEGVLALLAARGFRTEETNPTWLFKAFKDDVLVDIVFRSEGGFYFDDEVREHAQRILYHGRQVPIVSAEDFILIKCAVHSEEGPHHWHDALAALSHSKLNWDYLLQRSRKAARRLLALLIYAQADDIWVPNHVVQQLFRNVFGEATAPESLPAREIPESSSTDKYLAAQLREAFAQSDQVGVLGVEVFVQGKKITLRGDVQTSEQQTSVTDLVRKQAPGFDVHDQLRVIEWEAPRELKDIV